MKQPRVWTLLDDRPGHQTQVNGLADRLGWPFEPRKLSFNRLNKIPNPLLGASLVSVDTRTSDSVTSEFPDLVISMGRRCVPVARWIRQASGGRSKLVHLGRKGVTAADEFILLISCAHFNMPPHTHRLAVILPPTQVTAERLAEAKGKGAWLLAERKHPHMVFLIGGETALHTFPNEFAVDVLRRAEADTAALGGSLTVVTSRRTSSEAIKAMQSSASHAVFQLWDGNQTENPYLGYLAWADGFIVGGESESMLAEVASTNKPLHIVPMPHKRPKVLKRLRRRLYRQMTYIASEERTMARFCRPLFNSGWLTPYRDLEKMHELMYQAHLARPFESELSLLPPATNQISEQISNHIINLLTPITPCPVHK